jgi:hypothetical protein
MFLISQSFTLGDRMVNKRLILKQLGQLCSLYPRPLNRSTDSSCRSWNSSAENGEDADEQWEARREAALWHGWIRRLAQRSPLVHPDDAKSRIKIYMYV